MKIRTDFVTNSSSSSFVVAFDNNDDVVCAFVKALCDASDYDETSTGKILNNKDEFEKYYRESYSSFIRDSIEDFFARYPDDKAKFDEIMELFDTGKSVMCKNIGYSASSLVELLRNMANTLPDKITVIEED